MDTVLIIVALLVVLCCCSSSSIAFFVGNYQKPTTSDQDATTPINTTSTPTSTPTTTPTPTINANPGEAISCTGYNPKGDGAVYRYDGNKRMRWYPNEVIAASWDPNWTSGINRKVDCTGFTLDNDIALNANEYISFKHKSGKCVHPNGGSPNPNNGTTLVFWDGCDEDRLKYKFTPAGSIQHKTSGKCLHPNGGSPNPSNNTQLVFWDGCGEDRLRFERLPNGAIRHVTSGKCIHPSGGSASPGNGTELVLYDGCNEDKNIFV